MYTIEGLTNNVSWISQSSTEDDRGKVQMRSELIGKQASWKQIENRKVIRDPLTATGEQPLADRTNQNDMKL